MTSLNPILPANEARSNFYQMLNTVGEELQQYTITLRGKAQAVVMSTEEFASWQETLGILSDKQLVTSIQAGQKSKKIYSQKQADKIIGW